MSPASASRRRLWDRLGALLSGLCLAHCLLLPVALIAVPGYAAFGAELGAAHETTHLVLAALLLPVALVALHDQVCCSTPTGSAVSNTGLLLGGLALVGLAWPAHELLGPAAETTSTIAGSVLLVAGHVKRLSQKTRRF